jgi:hypothetical protein
VEQCQVSRVTDVADHGTATDRVWVEVWQRRLRASSRAISGLLSHRDSTLPIRGEWDWRPPSPHLISGAAGESFSFRLPRRRYGGVPSSHRRTPRRGAGFPSRGIAASQTYSYGAVSPAVRNVALHYLKCAVERTATWRNHLIRYSRNACSQCFKQHPQLLNWLLNLTTLGGHLLV